MTLKELSQAYYLKKEIALLDEQIASLWRKATSSTASQSDAPGSHPGVSDKVGNYSASLADSEKELKLKKAELEKAEENISRYIDAIPDSMLRLIFTYRFLRSLSWVAVAHRVGGGNTEASVKMQCYRYLKGGSK
jgi:hypothetical protein